MVNRDIIRNMRDTKRVEHKATTQGLAPDADSLDYCPKKTPSCANRLGNHLKDIPMIALLTAKETLTQPEQAHRYMVELASNELDCEGVPVDVRLLDVCVTVPSKKAIELLIASADWLKGYSLGSPE